MAIVLKPNRTADQPDSADAARKVSGLAGFNLDDLADQGRLRIDQCREETRKILEAAKNESEKLRQQAKQQGRQEGLASAENEINQRVKKEAEKLASDSLATIHQAVQQLHVTYESWMQQYADSLSAIAIAAAEKIVKQKLEQDQTTLVRWAEEAVYSARSASQLTIAVHPETLANLGQTFDELLASADLPEQSTVEADESVAIDAVVIRQPGGQIHAGLTEQLERLRELLS
ncbi:flagellar assembly protein H [Planctomycetes bacterium CA13]|uniref:Flagellar assembly protein FliH n=1 Tax=Novipirellula herctigrandis TaxID=2527986 RepID=A0A5C5ZA52_9BACT|nr:flagellar assembly protein H [Planctomycetes bacterium CA13]